MNFQELMSKASANKSHSLKQQKKSRHHKDSTPGVSNSSVKAFVEKKLQEQKKKQVEKEAARLARIQARLDQNLKSGEAKKGKSEAAPKSSFLNPPYKLEEEQKTTQGKRKKKEVAAPQKQHRTSKPGSSSGTSKSKSKDNNRKPTTSNIKINDYEKQSKEKSGKNRDLAVNGKKSEPHKSKKKIRTAPPPPNFKELLAIAEQNKSGLNRPRAKMITTKKKEGKEDVEDSKARRQQNGSREQTLTEIDKRNIRDKNKERIEVKTKGKQAAPQRKSVSEPDLRRGIQGKSREGPKTLKRTRESETLGRNVLSSKSERPVPHYARPPDLQHMSRQNNNYPSSRQPHHGEYYEEEEDSDMDSFIDDGQDELCDGQTDVSKCIKDIFGYDRRKYANMKDFDDAAMESSFGQIEREEKRSGKIAKLEDEIDILKEQAELKKLRDKLKLKSKNKK